MNKHDPNRKIQAQVQGPNRYLIYVGYEYACFLQFRHTDSKMGIDLNHTDSSSISFQ